MSKVTETIEASRNSKFGPGDQEYLDPQTIDEYWELVRELHKVSTTVWQRADKAIFFGDGWNVAVRQPKTPLGWTWLSGRKREVIELWEGRVDTHEQIDLWVDFDTMKFLLKWGDDSPVVIPREVAELIQREKIYSGHGEQVFPDGMPVGRGIPDGEGYYDRNTNYEDRYNNYIDALLDARWDVERPEWFLKTHWIQGDRNVETVSNP